MTAAPSQPGATRMIIPAATVIVFRHSPQGGPPELMMMERANHMRFAAGASVFPGGRIDPADHALARDIFPDADPADTAARIAAIRECLEETGLLLAVNRSVTVAEATQARALLGKTGALATVLEAFGLTLELDRLVPFARWCPPWNKAFDTRFYLTDLGTGAVSIAEDGDESTRLYWASAAETLRMIAAGEVTAIFPTICNLQRLATFADFAAATAQARALPPRLIEPWSETADGVEYLCIPADAGYPQPRHRTDEMARGAP